MTSIAEAQADIKRQINLFTTDELRDKIDHSIAVLQTYAPQGRPYYGAFSGGKDSCVIKELARMAGVKVIWHYYVTTIDPPELTRFIKQCHPDVVWDKPKENFFTVAERRGFPRRLGRWCCEEFKESKSAADDVVILGVRHAESARRKKSWKEFSVSIRGIFVLPIISWTHKQVWQFIHDQQLPYCLLYDVGCKRLGCIGCPMTMARIKHMEFERWPHMERRWKALFKFLWNKKTGSIQRDGQQWFGDRYFDNWEEMWNWWLNDEPLKKDDDCQGVLDFYA